MSTADRATTTGESTAATDEHEHHGTCRTRHHEHVPAAPRARVARWFDARVGGARIGQGALQKIFPNHWSFLLGEVALYSFLVLISPAST